jgi:CBS domain containing-hemolysin-like protein
MMHVPDTMKLDDALREMREKKEHMAIVTDEYGGTDGLITIEDIMEEIFGEIHDEYDKEETPIRKVGPRAFVIDARAPLDDVAEAIDVALDDNQVETVGGWVMHSIGRIPESGEVLQYDRFKITVLAGGVNFISRIRLEVLEDTERDHEPQS